jgi:nicotinate-nucleotide pyrophosphorylase (carboxylating)
MSIPSAAIKEAQEATDLLPGQDLAHLLPPSWTQVVPTWFAEDTPSYDWAGFVVGEEQQEAFLLAKSGVCC